MCVSLDSWRCRRRDIYRNWKRKGDTRFIRLAAYTVILHAIFTLLIVKNKKIGPEKWGIWKGRWGGGGEARRPAQKSVQKFEYL